MEAFKLYSNYFQYERLHSVEFIATVRVNFTLRASLMDHRYNLL